MFAAVVDDLKVQFCPGAFWEECLEVSLGLSNVFAFRKLPTFGEAVNVSVDRDGGGVEGLDHDDGGRFVSHSGEGFEVLQVVGNLGVMSFD